MALQSADLTESHIITLVYIIRYSIVRSDEGKYPSVDMAFPIKYLNVVWYCFVLDIEILHEMYYLCLPVQGKI